MLSASRLVSAAAIAFAGSCQLVSGLADYEIGAGTGGIGAQGGGGTGGGLPVGQPCAEPGECASGYCFDAVCCADECNGPCAATCNQKGSEGTCVLLPPGSGGTCAAGLCDTAGECAVGAPLWGEAYGHDSETELPGPFVAVDGDGYVVTAGSFAGTLTGFGSQTYTAVGKDIFLARVPGRTEGPPSQWHFAYGGDGDQSVTALAVGPGGEIAVAGTLGGTLDLSCSCKPSPGKGPTAYVAVLTPSLECSWVNRLEVIPTGSSMLEPQAIAFDGGGRVIVAGVFRGTLTLPGGALTSSLSPSIFVVRFTVNGKEAGVPRSYGEQGTKDVRVGGIAADAAGNLMVVGSFTGQLTIGGEVLDSGGGDLGNAVFMARLTWKDDELEDGWGRAFGGAGMQQATAVALDGAGSAVVAGHFEQGLLDGEGPTSQGGSDIFVTKVVMMDPEQQGWLRTFGSTADDHAYGVAVDANRNVVIAGDYAESIDLGGPPKLVHLGVSDAFVAKYGDDGKDLRLLWAKSLSAAGSQRASSVAIDPGTGEVAIAGYLEGTVKLGDELELTGSGPDPFVAWYSP